MVSTQKLRDAGWSEEVIHQFSKDNTILSIKNVSVALQGNLILDDVSFSVEKGEILGIVGSEGAGKTILLHALVGLIPSKGSILYLEEDTQRMRHIHSTIRGTVGFSPQRTSFYPELTVQENVMHFATLYYLGRKERAEQTGELLNLVGLEEVKKNSAQRISTGMKRRLDIACSMVHNPDILFLDAPFADLDELSKKNLCAILKKLNKEEKTIILTDHRAERVKEICSRTIQLEGGRLKTNVL